MHRQQKVLTAPFQICHPCLSPSQALSKRHQVYPVIHSPPCSPCSASPSSWWEFHTLGLFCYSYSPTPFPCWKLHPGQNLRGFQEPHPLMGSESRKRTLDLVNANTTENGFTQTQWPQLFRRNSLASEPWPPARGLWEGKNLSSEDLQVSKRNSNNTASDPNPVILQEAQRMQ